MKIEKEDDLLRITGGFIERTGSKVKFQFTWIRDFLENNIKCSLLNENTEDEMEILLSHEQFKRLAKLVNKMHYLYQNRRFKK